MANDETPYVKHKREKSNRKMLSARISQETQQHIKTVAYARSISIGGWIDLMVKRDMEKLGLNIKGKSVKDN